MLTDAKQASPFKFLDAYTAQDTTFFFGREGEQKRLVELIYSSKLVLVYGASGTGKSSLVQCGLAKAITLADYFPVVVRRRENFNESLTKTLTGILQEEGQGQNPIELVGLLSKIAMRPVYLLFDQFEELFISGSVEEQNKLVDTFQALYQSNASCRLLIIMREEYIAQLDAFEARLPQLFSFRLRVEPMSEQNLESVICKTFGAIQGVKLREPEQTAKSIIHNIRLDKALFQLPYLQVYLDRLWRLGNQQYLVAGADWIQIDTQLVTSIGEIDNVLETFLREQKEAIIQRMGGEESRPILDKVLECFVTYEATRREQRLPTVVQQTGLLESNVREILVQLENSRILREDEGTYELPHDSLALIVDKGRSVAQRRLNDITRRLKDNFQEYLANPTDDLLLPLRRLTEIRDLETALREELIRTQSTNVGKIWAFIEASEAYQQWLQDQKLAEQSEKYRQKQRQRTILGGVMLVALLIAVGFSVFAWREKQKATGLYLALASDNLPTTDALQMLKKAADLNGAALPVIQRLYSRFNETDSILLYRKEFLHNGKVRSAKFSPDGRFIGTSSWDSTAKIWDSKGNLLLTLKNENKVNSINFSPDSQWLVCTLDDKLANVWTLKGKLHCKLSHSDKINYSNFSKDSRFIVTASKDRTAVIWDIKTGSQIYKPLQHSQAVMYACFSPDGKKVATASEDNTAKIWDLSSNQVTLLQHEDRVNFVKFSPDGKRIITVSADGTAKAWTYNGKLTQTLEHSSQVIETNFSSDSRFIITISKDNYALVWDDTNKPIDTLRHKAPITFGIFSPNNKYILTSSEDNTVRVWNIDGTIKAIASHRAAVISAFFSPDGKQIVSASEDNSAKLWHLDNSPIRTISDSPDAYFIVGSPDNQTFFTACGNDTAKIWNVKGETITKIFIKELINTACFSPDGSHLITGYENGKANLWTKKGKVITTICHKSGIQFCRFSPNGQYILTASNDATAKVWELNGNLKSTLYHKESISFADFSPDGAHIATSSGDGTAKIWDMSGRFIRTLPHFGLVKQVRFSQNSRLIVTSSADNTAKVWNSRGKLIAVCTHTGMVNSAAFSQNGQLIATASDDKTAKVWNLNGKRICTLYHQDKVNSIQFSPDSEYIITGSEDRTAKIWKINGELIYTLPQKFSIRIVIFSNKNFVTFDQAYTAKIWFTGLGALNWLCNNKNL